jgi:hypothetical protein
MPEYLPRLVDPLLAELLADHPALLVVGPRAFLATSPTTGAKPLTRMAIHTSYDLAPSRHGFRVTG